MKKKILIIEDEQDLVFLLKIRLEDAGYKILSSNNINDAMTMITNHKPDLVLLDLLLPGGRGEEFCKNMKSNEEFKNIPVILCTATAHNLKAIIKETGANDGIMKPFNVKTLFKKIDKYLNNP